MGVLAECSPGSSELAVCGTWEDLSVIPHRPVWLGSEAGIAGLSPAPDEFLLMTSEELRALLKRARMTQKDAADRCGVTLRTVQNWVSGATPVPAMAEQALIIAEAERDAVAFERDTQTPADARAALEWIAGEQRRRIALLEREIEAERAALAETLERIGTWNAR